MLASLPPHASSPNAFERLFFFFFFTPHGIFLVNPHFSTYDTPLHHSQSLQRNWSVGVWQLSSAAGNRFACLPCLSTRLTWRGAAGFIFLVFFFFFIFLCCCCLLRCVIGLLICGRRRMWAAGVLREQFEGKHGIA
ncbi:hypothetical protein IWX90DRAFT_156885 [Phyllosticta citrichinensis]|uniref:Transmembrane protein n=1 Tax=Phyllosticta citrichinensis TaxID=1130410 RepID=A0ABR1Y035_9PEZI